MNLFTKDDLKRIEDAIQKTELSTDAEIVAVFAEQSDSYYYIPTLVAAILALVAPNLLLMTPYWLEMHDILLIQILLFFILALALRFKPIMSRLIPKFTMNRRADLMARYQFLEQNLHVTHNNLGVLIYISQLEHQVRILVDHGIAKKIDNSVWEDDVDNLIQRIKVGEPLEGIIDCITTIGNQLAKQFPYTHEKNELCNKLVII